MKQERKFERFVENIHLCCWSLYIVSALFYKYLFFKLSPVHKRSINEVTQSVAQVSQMK